MPQEALRQQHASVGVCTGLVSGVQSFPNMELEEGVAALSLDSGGGPPEAAPGPATASPRAVAPLELVDIALKQALSSDSRGWGELRAGAPGAR